MKLLALCVALAATACSVNHRSDTFRTCESTADCGGGERCSDGICVGTDNPTDGGNADTPGRPDALECPSQCNSCKLGTMECLVDCEISPAICNAPINCPPGWNCNIKCNTQGACRQGITCTEGASCNITCSGSNACRDVECGAGPCDVECSGISSCRDVACGDSCKCDVTCSEIANCNNVTCSLDQCEALFRGCSSEPAGCNTCP